MLLAVQLAFALRGSEEHPDLLSVEYTVILEMRITVFLWVWFVVGAALFLLPMRQSNRDGNRLA